MMQMLLDSTNRIEKNWHETHHSVLALLPITLTLPHMGGGGLFDIVVLRMSCTMTAYPILSLEILYIHIRIRIHTWLYVRMYVCMHACMQFMYVCLYKRNTIDPDEILDMYGICRASWMWARQALLPAHGCRDKSVSFTARSP